MYSKNMEYYDLPIKYDETTVKLLVQSPNKLYAYWEVSDATIKAFSKSNGSYNDSIPFLRIYNLTMHYYFDIQVDPFTNNYYIDVRDPNCKYKVILGRKLNQKFIDISSSNEIVAPRADSCHDIPEEIILKNYLRPDGISKLRLKKYLPITVRKFANQNHTDFENQTPQRNDPNNPSSHSYLEAENPSSHSHISSGSRYF